MYSGKQALRLEKFKASDIGGLDKELKKSKEKVLVNTIVLELHIILN